MGLPAASVRQQFNKDVQRKKAGGAGDYGIAKQSCNKSAKLRDS